MPKPRTLPETGPLADVKRLFREAERYEDLREASKTDVQWLEMHAKAQSKLREATQAAAILRAGEKN